VWNSTEPTGEEEWPESVLAGSWLGWNSGEPTGEEWPERERKGEEGEKENKTIKKYYLKKMKCRIEIIVGVVLRKLEVKVEIDTFLVATLTPTAGDALSSFKIE
jgi:hypothetical protein